MSIRRTDWRLFGTAEAFGGQGRRGGLVVGMAAGQAKGGDDQR
ncbi:MAG: hypothetical protein Q8K78_00340 [Planctomycetaceae bacterium]|nr:hypothetical protein [Planctomycetaceae bacterium]